ncbi:hypothetical protein BGX23_012595 [Mortierella sp. AD031]|nr:hypothetical protein BGX23_012595 [Mortierella sp. AD031]
MRAAYKNGPSEPDASQSEVVHIACHHDPSIDKDIILWDDILAAFKEPLHIRCGLEPLCIAAVTDALMDVVVESQLVEAKARVSQERPSGEAHAIEPVQIAAVPETALTL